MPHSVVVLLALTVASVHAQPAGDDEQPAPPEEVTPIEAAPPSEAPPVETETTGPDESESATEDPQTDETTTPPEIEAVSFTGAGSRESLIRSKQRTRA